MDTSNYPYGTWVLFGLAIYMIAMLGIGWYASRKVADSSDFLVAGRRLGHFLGTGALFATWFGAGTAMGGAGNAYIFGNQGVIFDPWGAGLCLVVVGFFFARLLRRGRFITLVDLYDSRFGRRMGLLAGISMVVAEMGWVGAMLVGFGTIIEFFTGLPLSYGIAISTVIMVAYTLMGGMWAVTLTDSIQMLILIAGMVIMLLVAVPNLGGWGSIFASASDGANNLLDLPKWSLLPTADSGFLGYTGTTGWLYWAGAWMAIGFGSIPAQDLAQRVLAARDEPTSVANCMLAGLLYVTVGLIPVILGMLYFQANPGLTAPEASNSLLLIMAAEYLSPVTITIFVSALVAALMSSASGAVLAASSIIGHNGFRLFKPDADGVATLRVTRIAIPVVTGVSLWLALSFQTIYNLMVISWSVLLVSLFASYVAAFYWRRANETGAIAGYLGGMAVWVAAYFYYLPATKIANTDVVSGVSGVYFDWAMWDALYIASVWGLGGSIACLVAVSLATRHRDAPKPLVDVDGRTMTNAGWFGPGRLKIGKLETGAQ